MRSLPSALPPSTLNGRYRLDELLGEGGSALVYRAVDTWLERAVAVKVMRTTLCAIDGATATRFSDEARALARLSHPNVVTIHDVGASPEGVAFLVMELVADGSLEDHLVQHGPMTARALLPLLLPVMGALACAHDRGIVHRDLKPANVALARAPDGGTRAKLLDFGIAKLRAGDTGARFAVGTPAYMAPEQARAGRVGPQTDVWAMGVLLYRALSGRLPFDAPTPEAVMCQVVSIRPPPLRSVCPELSEHVALTIDRALEPAPQLRHAEMRSFARALAIAAQRDGLSLPAAPDPIGLPDFAAWLASADVLTTAPAGAAWSAPAQRRAPASPPLRSRQQSRWLVPAGLLVVAATVAAAAVLARDAPERAPAAAVAAQARHGLAEPMAESLAAPLAAPANAPPRPIAPDVAPVDASVSAPSAPRRPPGRDHRRQPSSSERRRGAELIREWDW